MRVHAWPGEHPLAQNGVCVMSIVTTGGALRAQAREQVRSAVREVLSLLLGIPAGAIAVDSTPGQPPRIVLAYDPGRAIACSFAHEDGWSLAAINLRGAIGVDLMRVRDVPDWQAVARDYLGPAVTADLSACPPWQRARAFALAWTAREAHLKR